VAVSQAYRRRPSICAPELYATHEKCTVPASPPKTSAWLINDIPTTNARSFEGGRSIAETPDGESFEADQNFDGGI
jgi:hypothetical protein